MAKLSGSILLQLHDIAVSHASSKVIIQQWAVCGLPNDNLSVENGIIIATARQDAQRCWRFTQSPKMVSSISICLDLSRFS